MFVLKSIGIRRQPNFKAYADPHSSLTALAQGAKQYKLTCPQMTHENVLYIKNGMSVDAPEGDALVLIGAAISSKI